MLSAMLLLGGVDYSWHLAPSVGHSNRIAHLEEATSGCEAAPYALVDVEVLTTPASAAKVDNFAGAASRAAGGEEHRTAAHHLLSRRLGQRRRRGPPDGETALGEEVDVVEGAVAGEQLPDRHRHLRDDPQLTFLTNCLLTTY